ncbi:MAG: hypothetical protein AAB580_00550 [Patescibacteria group bacterium]
MDNIGLQPPQPSIVTVEEPKIIKPAGGFGRIMRKHGLKFLMGGLLTLLLGAGIWLEVKVVQQKQQVESQATGVSGCAGHIEKCECDNDPDDDCSWKSNGSCYGSCYSGYNDCAGSCESEPDEVLPSPSPSPAPPLLCTIQGRKVIMPGNQRIEPASSQTVTLAGNGTSTANPYYFVGVAPGNKTVSVSTPGGYTVGYTLCINNINCHDNAPTPGSSVTFDCPAGNYPADGYADLYWHYTPISSPSPNPIISCTDLTSNVAAPVVGQSVTGTCHGSFSSVTAPVARFGVSINGGEFMRSEIIPLNAAGTANYTVTVPIAGTYLVQCQICTDATASTCTTWGQAN